MKLYDQGNREGKGATICTTVLQGTFPVKINCTNLKLVIIAVPFT